MLDALDAAIARAGGEPPPPEPEAAAALRLAEEHGVTPAVPRPTPTRASAKFAARAAKPSCTCSGKWPRAARRIVIGTFVRAGSCRIEPIDAGHLVPMEAPETLAAAIRRIYDSTG